MLILLRKTKTKIHRRGAEKRKDTQEKQKQKSGN